MIKALNPATIPAPSGTGLYGPGNLPGEIR